MFKYINLKKFTANALIGIILASSLVVESRNNSAIAGSCSNNGHGNNGDIVITLPSGLKVLLQKFDPSNPGNGNKITKVIKDSNPGISNTNVNTAKNIILAGNYDYENKPKAGNDTDCDGIKDEIEVGNDFNNPRDTDGDGTPDFVDTDSDGDGIPDSEEGTEDSDDDNIPDYIDNVNHNMSAILTADNHYGLLTGNENGSDLNFIGRNEKGPSGKPGTYNWSLPETWSFALDQDDYIYVVVWDDASVDESWIGEFTLNTGEKLLSVEGDWEYIISSGSNPGDYGDVPSNTQLANEISSANWINVKRRGPNGMSPWGTIPGISNNANFLNTTTPSNGKYTIFRTKFAVQPELTDVEEEEVEETIVDTCSTANSITLTGTVRDFLDTHPDFEYKIANDRNMVTTQLGSDRKPVYGNHPNGKTVTTNGKEYFDQWYRDVDGVNAKKTYDITLTKQPNGNYRYSNTSFFPIDGQLKGNQGRNRNFHFTYELHSQFTYKGGEVLNFSGDDDVWVYINGKRVIDLGGVHARQDASVNIDSIASSIGLQKGKTYDFDFFFAERHTTQSNFILETSIGMLCDSDKDGISDIVEGTSDPDGDGIPNYLDPDSDGDGIPDVDEGTEDFDNDGTPDYLDDDSDNNGIPDYQDSREDVDSDGILDYQDPDNDPNDRDEDGISNDEEENIDFPDDFVFPEGGSPDDIDGDGVLNEVDPDGDGNGVPDVDENNGDYGYGFPPVGSNDLPPGGTLDDIDGDGVLNGLDTNDDGDDMPDIQELANSPAYPNEPNAPVNGNLQPNPGLPDMYYD